MFETFNLNKEGHFSMMGSSNKPKKGLGGFLGALEGEGLYLKV